MSLRHRDCDRGSGVPSTISLSFLTIYLCATFTVLGRGLLSQQPGNWETAWRSDALFNGGSRSRGTLAWMDGSDASTTAQLLETGTYDTTLELVLVMVALPWDGQEALC